MHRKGEVAYPGELCIICIGARIRMVPIEESYLALGVLMYFSDAEKKVETPQICRAFHLLLCWSRDMLIQYAYSPADQNNDTTQTRYDIALARFNATSERCNGCDFSAPLQNDYRWEKIDRVLKARMNAAIDTLTMALYVHTETYIRRSRMPFVFSNTSSRQGPNTPACRLLPLCYQITGSWCIYRYAVIQQPSRSIVPPVKANVKVIAF